VHLHTQAFEGAWAAACNQGASTVLVPPELEFLVGPISFSGPYCKPNIVFQVIMLLIPNDVPNDKILKRAFST